MRKAAGEGYRATPHSLVILGNSLTMLMEKSSPGIDARLKEIEAFVLSGLRGIQGRLAGEVARAKAELAKHCMEITLTPEGNSYKLSGEWDLLGDVRSDGAGGQNRTGYARLFRAALYQ
jgi:hypothetical protein